MNTKRVMKILAGVTFVAALQCAAAFEPSETECIAPANRGGGWDFTCREVGELLSELELVPGTVEVTNMPGEGGGVAFEYVVRERAEDPNLLVAASTATLTQLAQKRFPELDRTMVRWLAAMGADFGVIAVAQDSPYQNLGDLVAAMKENPNAVNVGGGSAIVGFDHLKLLLVAMAGGVEDLRQVKYVPFLGGGEALLQVMNGHLQAFSGDVSEVVEEVASGEVRALAVLWEERLPGELAEIPTAVEQGFDVVASNWRGFYMPKDIPDDAYAYWVDSLQTVYDSPEWKQMMASAGLLPFWKSGPELQTFVDQQIADIEALSRKIGLIQ